MFILQPKFAYIFLTFEWGCNTSNVHLLSEFWATILVLTGKSVEPHHVFVPNRRVSRYYLDVGEGMGVHVGGVSVGVGVGVGVSLSVSGL